MSDHTLAMMHAADLISLGAILGAAAGALPAIAALIAVIWYAIQVWESHTIQSLVRGHRAKKRRKRTHHHQHKEPPEIK